jgi:hypothetical protein
MAETPDGIILKRHRDFEGRKYDVWARRILMGLAATVPVVALFNVFGQRPDTHLLVSPAATLKLYAPARLRSGLLYEARFHIVAKQDLKDAYLKLGTGWAEGQSINTIEPSPMNEASDNGRLSFELGHIPAGKSFILYMQFQVNPTNVAFGRRQTVELDDGKTRLLFFQRGVTVFP